MKLEPATRSIAQLAVLLQAGALDPRQLIEQTLDSIRTHSDQAIFTAMLPERAMREAEVFPYAYPGRPLARFAGGHPRRLERLVCDWGGDDDGGVDGSEKRTGGQARCGCCSGPGKSGHDQRRAREHERVRFLRPRYQPTLRNTAQSACERCSSHTGWFLLRIRRGGCSRPRSGLDRHRHWRIGAHSRRVQRYRRL